MAANDPSSSMFLNWAKAALSWLATTPCSSPAGSRFTFRAGPALLQAMGPWKHLFCPASDWRFGLLEFSLFSDFFLLDIFSFFLNFD